MYRQIERQIERQKDSIDSIDGIDRQMGRYAIIQYYIYNNKLYNKGKQI